MSRLIADQESRGGDGDPGVGEKDSVMRVNLAEGCGPVNAAPWREERGAGSARQARKAGREQHIFLPRLASPASRTCLARQGP
jgi:hypothetical protein